MPIKVYFKLTDVNKSIFIASSEAASLSPREEVEVIKPIEEGIQSGVGGVRSKLVLDYGLCL